MQTLLTAAQMKAADAYTINSKPISSVDLMESAAEAFLVAFLREDISKEKTIAVFCGKGNNGGDGLAIARLLLNKGYKNLQVFVLDLFPKQSPDFLANLWRLKESLVKITELSEPEEILGLEAEILVDAILGSGLNKPLEGKLEQVVQQINGLNKKVYAVDVPTGFYAEGVLPMPYNGISAYKTICFQRPKINFFFPESVAATEHFVVEDIGLDEQFIQSQKPAYQLVEIQDIKGFLKPRKPFSHKGTYGHALLIAGATQTMGAALLNAKGCLYTGAGLTTLSVPESGLNTLNTALPEVMYIDRKEVLAKMDKYDAIGIGSGLGTSPVAKDLLQEVLLSKKALVMDADALNLLAQNKGLQDLISAGSVLTPHMKEFDHLFGAHASWYDRLETARLQAEKLQIVIVLKNRYSFIVSHEGIVYINPTGNPGMAQGGMGDVLTGVITAYVAEGFSAVQAAITACYVHGIAGDDLAVDHFNSTASQVAENIPKVVRHITG
ncbi:NAD(P)H-hydrate dehydratase [Pedobacter immunditicola]|uniref:NAD(P)H-hydrate dehydratase n=1 Tax=Pedobacter immunditicola TaxID=3133440 RepID=UPI0030AE84FF